jgi:hypothetical protein
MAFAPPEIAYEQTFVVWQLSIVYRLFLANVTVDHAHD